ncbi:MAG: CoA ester lyase [Sphingopyxis sp.]|uniref:HpcH/HpaI aldolase/citrate lyase family protein n=1 Tax=Sphingopyxis sp. TaxID=1908224 RepID=UPI002AB92B8F|nr:CoA ester lyase [Sphingopyxis sp.]MDZ3830257.1 CoA ester lyase [Sphingopyxis sp.]
MTLAPFAPRSLLYVPGSNARALEKARGLAADMLIIDLEDAVPAARKAEARAAMRDAVVAGYVGKRVAVRINGTGSDEQAADLAALDGLALDAVVLPKVDAPADLDPARGLGVPLFAMIETPAAIYAARDIAGDPATHGLIAGLNDLAHELRLPDGMDRGAMSHAIQAIVLAARAAGTWCFDGVYNAIDDAAGFAAEAAEGRRLGFDGKTLIHPSQVDPCNAAFAPSAREIAAAAALVAAATGGAQRHDGRMIEDMHVAAARALLDRAARD